MTTTATYIRDQIVSRINGLYQWKSVRKVPAITIQSDQFPRLGVYMMSENETPDGDANSGLPRYNDEVTVAISVMDNLSKPEVLEGSVDAMIDNIKNTLMQDYTFVSLVDAATGNVIIDSIPKISRSYQFPNNGETYYLECRLHFTICFNTSYEPILKNTLKEIDITIEPNGDANAMPAGDTPFIITIPQ